MQRAIFAVAEHLNFATYSLRITATPASKTRLLILKCR